ncbi:MAG: hypothetical protein IJ628_02570 [Bacteroidaceae bacterium]|nr:hypothetical protein [Bacteroidaceae bacterium]
MRSFITCFLGISVLYSCQQVSDTQIVMDIVPKDSIVLELGLQTEMEHIGNKLYVFNMFSEDNLIEAYDINTGAFFGNFAPKGSGPNEYVFVDNVDIYKDDLLLFDLGSKKIDSYNTASSDFSEPTKRISMKDSDYRLWNICKTAEGYLASGVFPEGKFALLSESLDLIKYAGSFRPKPMESIDDDVHALANYGTQKLSRDKRYMADIIYNAGILTLYEVKANDLVKKWEYVGDELNYKVSSNGAITNVNPMGYISASVTTRYVYALYSGEDDDPDALSPYGQEVHVFDSSNGNMIAKYRLDRRSFSIDVDEGNSKMFVLSHFPEPVVLIYELPF